MTNSPSKRPGRGPQAARSGASAPPNALRAPLTGPAASAPASASAAGSAPASASASGSAAGSSAPVAAASGPSASGAASASSASVSGPSASVSGAPAPAASSADATAAIAALAHRYDLPDAARVKLLALVTLLSRDPLAPTAVRDLPRVIEDHLSDSLVALELDPVQSALRVADLGSGAGLPGLPLAIALPGAHVSLVESAQRKADFLRRALDTCAVTNADVVATRVESWRSSLASFDLVTARAMAALDVVMEYAAPVLQVGGALVVWRGRRDPAAESAAVRAGEQLGLEPREIRQVHPFPSAQNRHLHLIVKVSETPAKYPRRPGLALKRPLGKT